VIFFFFSLFFFFKPGRSKKALRFSKLGTAFALRIRTCILEHEASLGHDVSTFTQLI